MTTPRHGPRADQRPQNARPRPVRYEPEPEPEQRRRPAPAVAPVPQPAPEPTPRQPRWLLVLRVIAYVTTSLASILVVAAFVYGYLALQDVKERFASNPLLGGSSYSAPPVTGGESGTDNFSGICQANPTAPECNGTGGANN